MMPTPGPYRHVNLKALIRDVISSHTAVREGIATAAEKERVRRGEAASKHAANAHLATPGKRVGHG